MRGPVLSFRRPDRVRYPAQRFPLARNPEHRLRKDCEDRDGPGAVPRRQLGDPLRLETTKEHWQSTNHSNLRCAESEQKLQLAEPILAPFENRRAWCQTLLRPKTAASPPKKERRTN